MRPEDYFNVANVINLAGLALLIRTIIKDRNVLRGFSIPGSIISGAALAIVCIGYYGLGFLWAIILILPAVAFWFMASIFTWRLRGSVKAYKEDMAGWERLSGEALESFEKRFNK